MSSQDGSAGVRIEIRQEFVASATSVGAREINEDACVSYALDPEKSYWGLSAVLAVADGLGGHNAGDVASNLAMSLIEEAFVKDNLEALPGVPGDRYIPDALYAAFHSINERIISYCSESESGYQNMGTTLTVVLVDGDGRAFIGHVGDCRVFLVRGDEIEQLTVDHSPVGRLIEAGIITEMEAALRDDRNIIDQALGTDSDVEVDILEFALVEGDILVLTTDGLTNVVMSGEIPSIIRSFTSVQEAVVGFVQTAVARGTDDNATAAILAVSGPAAAGFTSGTQVAQSLVASQHSVVAVDEAGETTAVEASRIAYPTGENIEEHAQFQKAKEVERVDRKRKTLYMVIAGILAFLFFSGVMALLLTNMASHKELVRVPNLLGLPQEQAKSEAKGAGFNLKFDYKRAIDGEVGKVIEQNPEAGEAMEKGAEITAIVSVKGYRDVPELIGLNISEAIDKLQRNYLEDKVEYKKTKDKSKSDLVYKQDPPPGERIEAGENVTLFVYRYEEPSQPSPISPPKKKDSVSVTCSTCSGRGWITRNYQEQVSVNCPACGGYGMNPGGEGICGKCGGDGMIESTVTKQHRVTCPTCGGRGYVRR